jgi:lipid-A-disaccharide synthase
MQTGNPSGPIWFSVGEASGDLHGAELMKAFRAQAPDVPFTGMGGPAMKAEGLVPRHSMREISLVGITEILGGLPRILKLLGVIKKELAALRPRAIVLVDCPEFNFRIARMAKKLGIPVYYYISPQIWAWRSGRANFLREFVRKVICILPFEKDFYAQYGMDVAYVGHPLMDVLPLDLLDGLTVRDNRIGLLPGSRTKEVTSLLPVFAGTARRLAVDHPDLEYVLVRAPGMDESLLRSLWPEDIPVSFVSPKERYQTFRTCRFILAASGTVTLETALIGTPVLVAYKVSPLSEMIGRLLVNVQYVSLPNLILDREIYPEYIGKDASSENLARTARSWLDDPEAYAEVKNGLKVLRTMVGDPGAPGRAAKIILDDLDSLAASG